LDSLQILLDCKAIAELRARYFRCVDTFDLEGWLSVFTPDAVLEFDLAVSGPGQPEPERYRIEGTEGITEFWTSNDDRVQSVHHGHMPEITVLSDNEAKGIWAMEDIVEFTDSTLHGFGHYHESYRKEDGQWRIAALHLTRTRLEVKARGRMSL
jgi:uncharacterized protein (TIGR02246 family)